MTLMLVCNPIARVTKKCEQENVRINKLIGPTQQLIWSYILLKSINKFKSILLVTSVRDLESKPQ